MKGNFSYISVFDSTALRKVAVAVALICLTATATSCRSVRQTVVERPVYIHDTNTVTETKIDSVYFENIVKEFVKGDTVYNTQTVTKYVYKEHTDTVYAYKEVPVEVIEEKNVLVEKPLHWYQKTLMWLGGGLLVALLGFVISVFVNPRKVG